MPFLTTNCSPRRYPQKHRCRRRDDGRPPADVGGWWDGSVVPAVAVVEVVAVRLLVVVVVSDWVAQHNYCRDCYRRQR